MFAHRNLGGCSSSVSVSCPSLRSKLVAVAHVHLWSSFRWCSVFCEQKGKESPLLTHPKTMVSYLLGRYGLFPDSLPASCGALAPFRLCSCSQSQSSPWGLTSEGQASAPSPHPPWQVSRQAPQAGECCLAPILCAGVSLLCPLHSCCCTLLHGFEASPLPQSPSVKGLPSVWKLFLLHGSFPEVQDPFLFFCLCFFLFSFSLPRYVGIFLPFGKSEIFCQHSVGVL